MSLRSVKRLKEEIKKKNENVGAQEEVEEEEEPVVLKPKKQFFAMLESSDEDENENEENSISEAAKKDQVENNKNTQAESNKKKKKKKKKTKKAANEEDNNLKNPDENCPSEKTGKKKNEKKQQKEKNQKDEKIDIANDKEEEESKANEGFANAKSVLTGCLEIKIKLLQYNKELSKYFKNAKFSEGVDKTDEMTEKESKMMKMMKHRQYKPHKKYYLSNHKSYGTVPEKLNCTLIGTNEVGQRVFAFEPTKKYSEIQESYESMKNTHDPNMIFDFLRQNPYHMEAAYDIGEFFRLKGDYKQANGLMEQVLFLYEESFSYEFSKILHEPNADVCLSYDHNNYAKCFFNCLIKFVDNLGKKGCYKAALEFNKFLLKLNPIQDPKGALLCLDFNTLCARDYDYLPFFIGNFCKEIYKSQTKSIIYLPNMIYSLALSKFSKIIFPKESQKKAQDSIIDPSSAMRITDQEFDLATKTALDHLNSSHNTLLMLSILLYPSLIHELITKNEFHKQNLTKSFFSDWQKRPWKEILDHKLFTSKNSYYYSFLQLQNDNDSEGLQKIIEIYLERSKIVWNNNDVNQWVRACVGFVINKIESGFNYDEFIEGLCSMEATHGKSLPFSLGRYKHLTKHNFSDYNERLDLNNIPDVGAQGGVMNQGPPQGYVPVNTNGNLLSVVLQSLLPWYYLPQNQQQGGQQIPLNEEFENLDLLDDEDIDPANFN